jgi:hypothetical protein
MCVKIGMQGCNREQKQSRIVRAANTIITVAPQLPREATISSRNDRFIALLHESAQNDDIFLLPRGAEKVIVGVVLNAGALSSGGSSSKQQPRPPSQKRVNCFYVDKLTIRL